MTEVIQAAAELQDLCTAHSWRFCFIGGLALQRWGEPRTTVDADLTLITGFGGEEAFIQILLSAYKARIPDAERFAIRNRVLLLQARSGVGLDIALGALPFEELAVERSSLFTFPPATSLRTCSAEDLVVMKAFADRGKDWVDVEGIVSRQAEALDWTYIRTQLAPLVEIKGTSEILIRLEKVRG